jgi:DtxR family Mn-dependent transcriptional regulator
MSVAIDLSPAEENYLKAIYHLSADGSLEVSTNDISSRMNTRAASVSDMLKKLSAKKVIEHQPYMGVKITALGKSEALHIIRKHRLWEVFLVQKLHFHWDQVHEVAEQLEHIRSRLLIERLDEHLGFPKVDPHGDPIPDAQGRINLRPHVLISDAEVGAEGTMVSVLETSPLFLQYLDKLGLRLGCLLKLQDRVTFDGSVELLIDQNKQIIVSNEVARNVYISA